MHILRHIFFQQIFFGEYFGPSTINFFTTGTYWRDFMMILHGSASRSSKTTLRSKHISFSHDFQVFGQAQIRIIPENMSPFVVPAYELALGHVLWPPGALWL